MLLSGNVRATGALDSGHVCSGVKTDSSAAREWGAETVSGTNLLKTCSKKEKTEKELEGDEERMEVWGFVLFSKQKTLERVCMLIGIMQERAARVKGLVKEKGLEPVNLKGVGPRLLTNCGRRAEEMGPTEAGWWQEHVKVVFTFSVK